MGIAEKKENVEEKLRASGQEQVLRYWDELSDVERESLLDQILRTDFSVLKALDQSASGSRGKITPMEVLRLPEIEAKRDEFHQVGVDAIREGKVAAVLLAGGMGTRLGSDAPKGVYNIGITKEVFIFQRLIENLLDVVQEIGTMVDLYIMTSEKNDEVTRSFLAEHDYFGYDKARVFFFLQETAPAVDYSGKIYLEEKNRIATSPNGNGGWFVSLMRSEIGKRLSEQPVEWLNVFAVDNVLQRIADPVFVGATIAGNYMVGEKVVKKASPDESVGAVCMEDGRPSIIEYYELTDELKSATNDSGEPAYNYGVILNYLFNVKELKRIAGSALPIHRVEKKIPYLNEDGESVKPESPNGYKFETLVLDMIRAMDDCLAFEVVREKEFAPIKNKTGKDSVETARALCAANGIVL